MTAHLSPTTTSAAASSSLDGVVLAVSSRAQAKFLTSLQNVQDASSPTWILSPGVSPKGLPGNVVQVDRSFGRARSLFGSKSEARDHLEGASAVLVGAGRLALPFLLAARDQSIGSIFLESPDAPSGRRSLVARLADKTVVEWEHQLTSHPFATVLGETL